jgi:hypothetical protein
MSEPRSREPEGRYHGSTGPRRCSNCSFWSEFTSTFPTPRDQNRGQCRRNPPVIVYPFELHEVLPADYGFWPLTRPDDWCGEFQARDGTD